MHKKKTEPAERQIQIALRREKIIQEFEALLASKPGLSVGEAADMLGVSRSTLDRLVKTYRASGGDYNSLKPKKSPGRPSVLKKLVNQIGQTAMAEATKRAKGIGLDTESQILGWRLYAQSDACPPELAKAILNGNRSKHSIPPSLRAAVRLTPAEKLAHRGPRARQLYGHNTPRRVDIMPGDVFVADDTTPIFGWWVEWPRSEAYPHGVKLLQGQLLVVIDAASQCVIAVALIAREKSSYRAVDSWSLFGHTFETIGLPRLGFQLERGSWEANLIRGQAVECQKGEVSLIERIGGLKSLPTNLTDWHLERAKAEGCTEPLPTTLRTWTSFLCKTKSIEGAFNRMQALDGTLWGCLGRDQQRNPYEKTKKIFEACKRGAADPRQHFLSQAEITRRLLEIYRWLNNEPMEGEVFHGVPEQMWREAVEKYPLRKLPPDQKYLYRRAIRQVKITDGHVRLRLTDERTGQRYSNYYANPRVFAEHDGAAVAVYHDPENPSASVQVHLAKTGAFLCEAEYADPVGMFLSKDEDAHARRREHSETVMSAYATVAPYAPSRQVPPEIEARRAEAKEAAKVEAMTPLSAQPERPKTRTRTSLDLLTDEPPEESGYVGDLRMQTLLSQD